jgi:chemotaxis protein MotA
MDKSSVAGVFLAIAGIVAGLLIEGGNLGQILQPTAALIVFGGTMGAVLLQFPLSTVLAAFRSLGHVFRAQEDNDQLIKLLVGFANKARRNGVVSLDSDLKTIEDPFLRNPSCWPSMAPSPMSCARSCASAWTPPPRAKSGSRGLRVGRRIFADHRHPRRRARTDPGDAASGQHQEVGRGIAVAFVATIYGVGIANLFFLPFAGKMRIRIREEHQRREMMLEGVISILEGMNPRMLEIKLAGFVDDPEKEQEGATPHEPPHPRSRVQPRSLAGLLCRLHHPAVRLLRCPLRLRQGRSEKAEAGLRSPSTPLSAPWACFPTPANFRAASGVASEPAAGGRKGRHSHEYRDGRGRRFSPARVKDDLNASTASSSRRSPTRSPRTPSPSTWAATGWSSACARPDSLLRIGHSKAGDSPHPAPDRRFPQPHPYDLRVEGHTDNIPIHTAEFDSNWELSTARATRIARLFLDLKAMPPERISAAGYAEFHPVATTTPPRAALKIRRVDLVVLPLNPEHLHDHPFGPLPVKLRIEHPLPGPEVELAVGHRQRRFMVQQQRLQVSIAIILTGLVMLVVRPRRRKLLQPLADVLDQPALQIVHVNGSGDVHRRDKAQPILHPAPAHNLFHLVGDVNHLFALPGFENKVFRVALHPIGRPSQL